MALPEIEKVSAMPSANTTAAEDLLMLVVDPNGTPDNKSITIKNFLGNIASNVHVTSSNNTINTANTTFTGNVNIVGALQLTSDKLVISQTKTPTTNSDTILGGSMFYDANYLYIAVSNNNIKRVALSTFS